MSQDPKRPYVVNSDEQPRDQKRKNPSAETWRTVKTVALTTLVGATVLGSATWLWKTATKRAARIFSRRQRQTEQIESPYHAAPVYAATAAATYPAWPQPNHDIPDALREGPRLTNSAPQYQPPPQQVVIAPSPEIVAEIRRLGAHVDKRFAAVEQRIAAMDNPSDDDDFVDDEDDDEEEAPRRRN